MRLVDKNIKDLCSQGLLISKGYKEENVGSISYDLTLESFVGSDNVQEEIVPGGFLMVKTVEDINIPENMCGIIGEKNSILRTGIVVDGPVYQPGHKTSVYLRVRNCSQQAITLVKGQSIAQIFFDELKESPDVPYNKQGNASFNDETAYRNYGNYSEEYKNRMKDYDKAKEDIENLSSRLYGNVLTLMGVIVGIFSLISINSHIFSAAEINTRLVVAVNVSMAFCITFMLGLIVIIINHFKSKIFYICYGIALVIMAAFTFCFLR